MKKQNAERYIEDSFVLKGIYISLHILRSSFERQKIYSWLTFEMENGDLSKRGFYFFVVLNKYMYPLGA